MFDDMRHERSGRIQLDCAGCGWGQMYSLRASWSYHHDGRPRPGTGQVRRSCTPGEAGLAPWDAEETGDVEVEGSLEPTHERRAAGRRDSRSPRPAPVVERAHDKPRARRSPTARPLDDRRPPSTPESQEATDDRPTGLPIHAARTCMTHMYSPSRVGTASGPTCSPWRPCCTATEVLCAVRQQNSRSPARGLLCLVVPSCERLMRRCPPAS